MHVLSNNRVRIAKVVRGLTFSIGIIGVILLILSFWHDTNDIGGSFCGIALIGHMLTWPTVSKAKELDQPNSSD